MTSILTKLLSHNGNQDRRTPQGLFNNINKEFDFQLDPCTSTSKPDNLATPHSFLYPEQDGLTEDWSKYKSVFVNPPFNNMGKWLEKVRLEQSKGATVVVLVPVKSDTRWWHDYALKADEVRFVKGRVTFEGHNNPFIIGIALLVYRGNPLCH